MSAVLSPCETYRYRLERRVETDLFAHANPQFVGKTIGFFGINPSTADASEDDATVRKWTGFCKVWGATRFIVGNVFAYRATDVRHVLNDPGPLFDIVNRQHLRDIAAEADILVPCWGSRNKVPRDIHHIIDAALYLLRQTGKPMMTFGLTASGDPKHPLMLSYSTTLKGFE